LRLIAKIQPAGVQVKLAPALVERLDGVSQIEIGFPHEFFTNDMVRSMSSGRMWDRIDQ
jgi:hypothetical protein